LELGEHGKANFTWSMIGAVSESALNVILLIVVNRLAGELMGGIFTFGYSHAQLMYNIGTLEVSPFHSTDVRQKYRFADYFSLRVLSCALMVLLSLAYVLWMDGDPLKKRIVLYLCLYKMTDAMADLFRSMYQQHDRIEFAGKLSTLRVVCVLVLFTASLLATGNLEVASLVMLAVGVVTLLTYNLRIWRKFEDAVIRFRFSHVKEIAIACFPLFVSVFVMLYISNAPKYAIDRYCSDLVQNRYSILFMPAFFINLFCQFIQRPMLTPMAKMWNDGRVRDFRRNILLMMTIIFGTTLLGLGGAWLLGIPLLEWLYGTDLTGQRSVLMWVMVYGGVNAVNIFLYSMIAVTRRQQWLLYAYLIAAAVIFFLAPVLVQRMEMTGAILSSIIALGLLDIMLIGILSRVLHKSGTAS